ncbi:MAG: HAMP domain-containing histidine kinase [Candidatus Schekmanbacteria bacterium]|nr:HAMP domain-containing histidine kinase [Candidatus Schekmanbacteria bacterium]
MRVLVVEDKERDVAQVVGMLNAYGSARFDVRFATTVGGASAELAKLDTDVVLLDLSLPDCSGLETVQRVAVAAPGVAIVVLTGLADLERAMEALRRGAQDYLIKNRADSDLLGRAICYAIERKRVEQERNEALERLRMASRQKDEFLSTVSHDLRSPCTNICVATDILLTGVAGELSEDQRKVVEQIDRNVRRQVRLISDLLDLSRMESGTFSVLMGTFDLRRCLRQLVDELAHVAGSRGVTLHLNCAEDSVPVVGDEDRLVQVFTNLMENAIRFAEKEVSCTLQPSGASVVVHVDDDGPGVPAEIRERVFERFFKGENQAYRAGTGLGLTIVRGIVSHHGGTVGAGDRPWESGDSAPHGARFSVEIPIRS